MSTETEKCPNCGAPLHEGDLFCSNCGANAGLRPKDAAVCRNCGATLPEGAAFCTKCGAKARVAGKVNLKKDAAPKPEAKRRCPGCGSEAQADDVFCTNCGVRLSNTPSAPQQRIKSSAAGPTPPSAAAPQPGSSSTGGSRTSSPEPPASSSGAPASQQTPSSNADGPSNDDPSQRTGVHPADSYVSPEDLKPKRRHTALILAVVVVAVCVVGLVMFFNWEGEEINYIGSVKAWTPFRQSHELSYSVGQVLNKYMPDAVWTEKEGSGNSVIVEAAGDILGAEGDYAFEFVVTPDDKDRGTAEFRVRSVTHDGYGISAADPAAPLLYLFSARRENLDNAPGILEAAEAAAAVNSAPAAATPGAPTEESAVQSSAQQSQAVPAVGVPVPTVMVAAPPPAVTPVPTVMVATPSPAAAPTGFDANGLVFPDSSVRYLTRDELSGMSKELLGFARNEIFARNGNLFRKDKYADHYTSYTWYNNIPNKRYDIIPEDLNAIERANIALIQEFEAM